jgi:hypothetical protein
MLLSAVFPAESNDKTHMHDFSRRSLVIIVNHSGHI